MGATALEILNRAYRSLNLNEITSFSTTQEFPYKLSLDIINEVIAVMNRLGNYWFTQTRTSLPYSLGVYQYNVNTYGIDPTRILYIRTESTDQWQKLREVNYPQFQTIYRNAAITTAKPVAWTKWDNNIEFSSIPDQDYSLAVYHFRDMIKIQTINDTFEVPERDEDVLQECCCQIIGYRVGRWDYATAYQAMSLRISPLLASQQEDLGIAWQMPAAF